MAILKRTEEAMIKAMCGVKLIKKRWSQELMNLLGLKDTLDEPARAGKVRWYEHVLRKDSDELFT